LATGWEAVSGNANDRIFGIILAAGEASRFGRLKQMEPVGGTCLLGVVVENALRCAAIEKVVLVLGAGAEAVKHALGDIAGDDRLEIVVNGDYRRGMSTSLGVGLEAARAGGCDAALFLLGDMPMIDADLIDAMIARYRTSDRSLCYARTGDRPGHPIIARRDIFDEFMNVEGDIGGREVVRGNIGSALGVDVNAGGMDWQLDINDAADLETYHSLCRERNAS
jgi:molybdenum cofactor cytidylyltransferase